MTGVGLFPAAPTCGGKRLEFHAELILPCQNYFQSSAMHGQFVLVALENDAEVILGRVTTISSQGRLISSAGSS